MNIENQLTTGIRCLGLRCAVSSDSLFMHQWVFYLHQNLPTILQEIQHFLKKHPSGFVVIKIQEEGTHSTKSEDTFCSIMQNIGVEHLWTTKESYKYKIYLTNVKFILRF